MNVNTAKSKLIVGLYWIFVIVAVVVSLFPVVWMILTSIKSRPDIISHVPHWLFKPTLKHWEAVFSATSDFDFKTYFTNSLLITFLTSLLALLIGFPAAYSISRFGTLGGNFAFYILSIRMLPPIIFIVPMSILFRAYHLIDTQIGLILMYLTFTVPFATWILMFFMDEIPRELEESAFVDGYSRIGFMLRILIPLTMPGIIAVGLICFIFSWNEFLFGMVLSLMRATTMTVGAGRFVTSYGIWWGRIGVAITVALIPPVTLGIVGQRYLVRGLTMGAVK